jgi:ketosteroid isomerase-like protein
MANANYKVLTATTDDVKVKVAGNMAFVTGNWTSTTAPTNAANAEPHKDTGRFTGIYEKRGGKWMLVAEHWSEAQHDRKLMEQQVLKMGREYGEMIKRRNASEIEKILADEYLYTNSEGVVRNKTEDLATYKNGAKFEFVETTDQKVRVIGNNAAIETGTFRFKGTDKDGKPIDGSERYTTTWVWRDGRWQVAADHTSEIR